MNKNALLSFITAGDPTIEITKQQMIKMEENGATAIILGVPFSDPVAEGPELQEAYERALKNGITTDEIFNMLMKMKEQITVPVLLQTYYNPVFTYGTESFIERCSECGVSALIIPDLPYEEKEEVGIPCRKYGVSLVTTIAPASKERMEMIAREAEELLYCMPSLSGTREELETMFSIIRKNTNLPCIAAENVLMQEALDGIVIGSEVLASA